MDVHATGAAPASMLSVLRPDGSADPALDPGLRPEHIATLYDAMLTARIAGERLGALGEEGVIGFFPTISGNEAAVIGATSALREHDWIFPTHADFGAALLRGFSIASLVHRAFGDRLDPIAGKDMPGGLSARAQRIASVSAPPATHLPHAVGFAWSANRRGEDLVSAAYFDSSDIAAADFHTGLNFAGVMKAKTVFVCRVREGQESAAEHAIAYGIAGRRCDGSDVLAVVRAMREAIERAERGEGATVIDLALGGDPLARTREHLERLGTWDDDRARAVAHRVEDELASAIHAARAEQRPALESIHEDVYARVEPHLAAQRDELLHAPRAPR